MPNQPMIVIPGNPEFYEGEHELASTIAGLIDDLVQLVAPGLVSQPTSVE